MVRPLEMPLMSNGFALSTDPNRLGELEPTDPGLPLARLHEQYRAQGYLWLKGFLDRQRVLDFRKRYFTAFRDTGLIAPDSDPVDGIYGGGGEKREAVRLILQEVVRWASYEAFCLAEPIWRFYEGFLEGPPYLHKRKLIRHTAPGDPGATAAHYDLIYLRAGTDRLCTSWIPIGDTPVAMGGLVYLEGSDAWGREAEREFSAKNMELPPEERINAFNRNMGEGGSLTKNLPTLAERHNTRWLVADYEAGDMVVHSPYMIHASTMNTDQEGRMRLSTDIRYQRVRDEIDARWANHWSLDDML